MIDPIDDRPFDGNDDASSGKPTAENGIPARDDGRAPAVHCDRCGARNWLEAAVAVCTACGNFTRLLEDPRERIYRRPA